MNPAHFDPPTFPGYELLDSGGGAKLERFGEVTLARPDPQALWRRRRTEEEWLAAHLTFERESDRGGRWRVGPDAPECARSEAPQWHCRFAGATFVVRPTPFKHLGLFPEQAVNWQFVAEALPRLGPARPRLLNLFGYSGAASVLAVQAGYEVIHVDASKPAIGWTLENAEASGLPRDCMRVVCDDALAFVRREARRGSRYSVVLLDPPHHGRGPRGESWQLERDLALLVEGAGQLLTERSLLILSTYAVGCSPLAFANLLAELEGGHVDARELVLQETGGERLLPAGFCARWSRGLGG